jgi:hypothetical protein
MSGMLTEGMTGFLKARRLLRPPLLVIDVLDKLFESCKATNLCIHNHGHD